MLKDKTQERRVTEGIGSAGLEPYFAALATRAPWRWTGRVVQATGQTVESEGPRCSVGESCEVTDRAGVRHAGEVIGFRGANVLLMPLDSTTGIEYGDAVQALGAAPSIAVGEQMQGRILDALGAPLDGGAKPRVRAMWPLDGATPTPMTREPIREALQTGVRVIDGMLTVGRGQRIGIFGGSGVGKSTLIGMMTRNSTAADITVVGLVGERGREVREFVEDALGEEGRRRSVVLVSTSDQSPLLRMRAALGGDGVAEFMRRAEACAAGAGLADAVCDGGARGGAGGGRAAGEQGVYAERVYACLAKLVERAGNFERGSITAFYTVLMEGDDQQDPIVDSVRSLRGWAYRAVAGAGFCGAVSSGRDVLDSLSRLMPAVTTKRASRTGGELVRQADGGLCEAAKT